MACTGTTNYGWCQPAVGGDSGSWGTELNTALVAIDATVFAVSGVANAALPKGGGAMTGRLDATTGTIQRGDLGNVSGTVTLNMANAEYFTMTATGAITSLFLQNVPIVSGGVIPLVLRIVNGGAFAVTWPSTFKWPSGVVPTLSTTGTDMLTFLCDDNNANWRLVGIQLNLH